jgi:hypothetical protein
MTTKLIAQIMFLDTMARAATRRAITRAAAEIGKEQAK